MTRITDRFFKRTFWTWFISALMIVALTPQTAVWAAFGEDLEKPKPEFTREGDTITAKLIPRAKSTSVSIHFQVSGGRLIDVEGMDFKEAAHPGVDNKDFKSELFVIKIDKVSPGGEAKVFITSDFFSSSTQYWIFNRKSKDPWMNGDVQNMSLPDLVQKLVVSVKDGGPFDSDGAADGRITLVGGPKDSFWGYALGTLFIRFFGIFLVLSILMIGMILSGRVFQMIDKQKHREAKEMPLQPAAAAPDIQPAGTVASELAAAISVALHLHFSGRRPTATSHFFTPEISPWLRQGRERMMNARSIPTHRGNRLQNR
jgi:Na+-transporting methylmalonyl-CoA/oxaloacetate decarboxylase gamma subunit